jgi:hypothetical protein
LEWFTFFNSIPPARPVILLMDSHASHISPEVISWAKANKVFLLTFPAHITHLLQPLDTGIYKSLKFHWSHRLNDYINENATEKPNRTNFHLILNPAFILRFCAKNTQNAFKKTGIYQFSRDVITSAALAPSQLTNKSIPKALQKNRKESNISPVENTLSLPSVTVKPKRKFINLSAKCLTPPDGPTTPVSEASE